MHECKLLPLTPVRSLPPLPRIIFGMSSSSSSSDRPSSDRPSITSDQGLTLIHFSAQRKRFLWDKGCLFELFKGCLGGVRGYEGVFRVYIVSETAQLELKSGRV